MVGPRHPKRLVSFHAFIPDNNVLKGVVERMAHVQNAGHIRRRDDDGVRILAGIRPGMKEVFLLPMRAPFIVDGFEVKSFGEIGHF